MGSADLPKNAPEENWWKGLDAIVATSPIHYSIPQQGICPQEPAASVAYEMTADGNCRVVHQNGAYIVYELVCNADGSVTQKYFEPVIMDPGKAKCPPTPENFIPEDYCFAGIGMIPPVSGARYQCDSPGGNATLVLWSAKEKHNMTTDKVHCRDGSQLTTETIFPTFTAFPPTKSAQLATLFIQTPYDLEGTFSEALKGAGAMIDSVVYGLTGIHFNCATTLQQTRGLYSSGPPAKACPPNCFDMGNHTKDDAGDTGKWIEEQEWSNGVILTQGTSAMGMMALLAAGADPHITMRASWLSITTNDIREVFYRQGALINGIMGSILLPGFVPPSQCPREPIALHEGGVLDSPYWAPMKFDDWSSVSWPSLHRTSWYDMFQKGGLRTASAFYDNAKCATFFGCSNILLVDALGHSGLYGIPNCEGCFPYNATAQNLVLGYESALAALMLFTFQGATNDVLAAGLNVFWAGVIKLVPEKIVYVLGSAGNYMTSFKSWPEIQRERVFLGKNGTLAGYSPTYGSISYVYDSSNPAPTYGGWLFQNTNPNGEGSVDQSPLAGRDDVVHFNGEPLTSDLPLCGAITASLNVASTANDTDFVIRLVDQYPSGERYLIAEGIVRMRWRDNTADPLPMLPGHTYDVEIDMWSTCWVIAAGHRVGIDITSSSSFMYLPNPNTGLPLQPDGIWPQGGESYSGKYLNATNSVIFGLSSISLPVVQQSDLPVIGPLIIPNPTPPPSDHVLTRMGLDAMRARQEQK